LARGLSLGPEIDPENSVFARRLKNVRLSDVGDQAKKTRFSSLKVS
jgi:hypothetical protein